MKKSTFIVLILALGFLNNQCNIGDNSSTTSVSENIASPTTGSAVNTNTSNSLLYGFDITKNGTPFGSVQWQGKDMFISSNGRKTTSRFSKGKRKYYSYDGKLLAEVKFSSDGFKVRNSESELLWKVKYKGDKIKISDNEENLNPYELKNKGMDRAKIVKNEIELGSVRLRPSKGKIEINLNNTSYEVSSSSFDSAFGVLIMEEIPLPYRWIIISELLDKKK